MQKKYIRIIQIVFIGLALGAWSGEESEWCERYCVLLELEGPFGINQPFTASITVDPFEDISDLEIKAFSNSPIVSFGQAQWIVDVFDGQPLTVTTTVTISGEGFFYIFGGAVTDLHGVDDVASLLLTQSGGVINPTPDGPIHQGASQTEGTPYISSPGEPKPTPFDAYLPNPSPQAALSACGFSHASPSEWEGAGLSLTFYGSDGYLLQADEIVEGATITIQIDFQAPYDSSPNTRVKLGFCLPQGQTFFVSNALVNGKRFWEFEAQPGVIYTEQLEGYFTEVGVAVLPISAFVPESGEIYARFARALVTDDP